MNPDILSTAGLEFLMRWGHFLAGVTWIGLLYYFNFVQGEYFKEATPDAKADATKKLAPRALFWFRWGAMFTFLTGVVILLLRGHATTGWTFAITVGALAYYWPKRLQRPLEPTMLTDMRMGLSIFVATALSFVMRGQL